jgi:hypothetical protein
MWSTRSDTTIATAMASKSTKLVAKDPSSTQVRLSLITSLHHHAQGYHPGSSLTMFLQLLGCRVLVSSLVLNSVGVETTSSHEFTSP